MTDSARQIVFDPSAITYTPHRQFRPRGSHPKPAHWQSIREQALERDGHQCRTCEAREGDFYEGHGQVRLEVHHRHYRNWGSEQLDDVTTLCEVCHRVITDRWMKSRDDARTVRPKGRQAQVCESLPAKQDQVLPLPIVITTTIESLPASTRFS